MTSQPIASYSRLVMVTAINPRSTDEGGNTSHAARLTTCARRSAIPA